MKTLKYSLATLLALSSLNFLGAEEADPATQMESQKTDKTIPPSTKTSLLAALEGTTIGGYAYGQVVSMFGADADGTAARFRTWIDVNTGAYHGFSIGTTVFASTGSGAPDGGTFLGNSKAPNTLMALQLRSLYGRQTFQSSATVITAGKMLIATPFSDSAFDFGYGASIDNYDVKGVGFHAQAYAAYSLDDGDGFSNKESFTSEKGLFLFGISGDSKELYGAGFELWAGHAIDTIDFLTFADLNYTIAGVTLQTQIAATQVDLNGKRFGTDPKTQAKLRGLYNFQLAYAASGVSLAAGYTGSFGDGYGALLNGSAFNMGGQIWYDTVGSNGYDLTGSGGRKHADGRASTIQVGYLSLGYKGVKSLSLGLDYAYIGGDNNYMLMTKGKTNKKQQAADGRMDATMHEVSVSAKYSFTDKLSLSALVGSTFGDLQMGRARMRINYSF